MAFSTVQSGKARQTLMHPNHHIDSDMLLAYAAGTLGEAASLVVATHLSLCPACRAGVAAAEAVGGAFLDDIAPAPVSGEGVAAMLAKLDLPAPSRAVSKNTTVQDTLLPAPVRNYLRGDLKTLRWNWISPGVKYSEIFKDETGARVGFMRTQPGASITPHGHTGDELTLVLAGGYRDGAAGFRRGDLQAVDDGITHELVTDQDGECLCLVMVQGPIKPTRLIARVFRHFTVF